MTDRRPRFWTNVRPTFHGCFQFWPDHEDLIWAKAVWPILEDEGYFADQDDEAEAWTRRHILALAILYAESACRFGVPDFNKPDQFERRWLRVAFGSANNLDEALWTVGSALARHHQIDHGSEDNAGLFLPMIRSLVTGSGYYTEGADLDAYLTRAWERQPEMCEFREDELYRMWVGGDFASQNLSCVP